MTPLQPENGMNNKSHVSLEQHVCPVCGLAFDTGSILLDRRLHQSMERRTATGWSLCEAHAKLFEQGFVAMVECDPERSGLAAGDASLKPGQACRTGRVAHLRREVFAKVFNIPIDAGLPCVFVEPGVLEQLQSMVSRASS